MSNEALEPFYRSSLSIPEQRGPFLDLVLVLCSHLDNAKTLPEVHTSITKKAEHYADVRKVDGHPMSGTTFQGDKVRCRLRIYDISS
jgi:hypothetical protein